MKPRKTEQSVRKAVVRVLFGVCTVILLMASLAVCVAGYYVQTQFESNAPMDLFRLSTNSAPPKFFIYRFSDRVNRIGSAEELATDAQASSEAQYVAYGELPQHLIDAFVAIEDKRFYQHRGVDWYRTVAAGVTYVLGFSDSFGASTITQQTVKNITGNSEVTLKRKMQEILYALDLERSLDKSEILELYLNVISFSDGCIGVSDAARYYFSKAPAELTAAECATVAAITNNPSYYNPIRHPEQNLLRRNLILSEMHAQGYLDEAEYLAAVAEPLELQVGERRQAEQIHSWYTDMVLEDVISDLCERYGMSRAAASLRVYSGGLQIEMAMDPDIQALVEDYYAGSVRTPANDKGEHAQSALIVIDSRTGDILGVAGAVGEKTANRVQNFATQALRSPGSAIKPITVYGPALEKGIINWASVYDDVPVRFGASDSVAWPKNATGVYRGLTNVAYAVAHSTNTVAVRVLEEVGLRESYRIAQNQFHLKSLVDEKGVSDCGVAALALGQLNYGLTLREITCAYTVFADAGCYHGWRSYYRVLDSDGKVLLSVPDTSEPVLSAGNAAVMTKLLQGVVRDGTSSSITLDRMTECAGKTGTTQNDYDRWFIGYTPDVICGVWCGYEYPEPISGANICTGIWNTVMHRIVAQKGGRSCFEVPGNVLQMSYCKDSGLLTDDACLFDPRGKRTETGWFVQGTEPHRACDCHVLCHIDCEGGGISHGFCPEASDCRVGLIRAVRHFPVQVTVTDAQYVWRGDPRGMPPNPDAGQAYFEATLPDFCGRSALANPFNRSCGMHGVSDLGAGDESEAPPSDASPETLPGAPDTDALPQPRSPDAVLPDGLPSEADRSETAGRNKHPFFRIW